MGFFDTAPACLVIQDLDKASSISTSWALSKTGVIALNERSWAASPKCVSSTWPRFILDGTPIGFKIMSNGVPSSENGISSTGNICDITPLLPCRPAILSPTEIFLV